jgi:hypothetical protein
MAVALEQIDERLEKVLIGLAAEYIKVQRGALSACLREH